MSEIFPEQPITSLPEAVAFLGALPMKVGPVPQASERDRLRAAFVAALDEAHKTHPCPVLGDQIWSGCVHYDEAGRITGVGSCHSERRADAVLAVRDVEMDRLRTQVAELLEERHTTNEALDDAVQELRARQSCLCPPADQPGPHQVGCFFDGVPVSPPSERPVSAPVAALREVPSGETDPGRRAAWRMLSREEPHDSPLHQEHRTPHALPVPESCRLDAAGLDEVGGHFLGGAS